MAKKLDQELRKYTMKLTAGSPERLQQFYPNAGGYTAIIRALVDGHLRKKEEQLNRKLSQKKEMSDDRATTSPDDLPGFVE